VILEYGFSNYFSFKESAKISFRLDANCPGNISNGKDFSTVLGVKGANGSGKTQVLKGLTFIAQFCANSFSAKPEQKVGVNPFFSSTLPSEFYIEFRQEDSTYRYELTVSDEEVKREALYRTTQKKSILFERIENRVEKCIGEFKQLKNLKLRKNASIISTGNQYEITALHDVYKFFDSVYSNVFFTGHADWAKITTACSYLRGNEKALHFVKNFISQCDSGISDITIKSYKDKNGAEEYYPLFEHEANGKKHGLTDTTESSGTKTLFKWLPLYQIILENGGTLVFDEIDMNLHPHILPKIISLFLNKKTNPKNAQLIFATHDTEIIELLGRYRTYLVSKEENESFTYRLDEIPGDLLRNDRPIRPIYNSGRIGGIPKI
jgi:AAA15 family ATPase/GTPase